MTDKGSCYLLLLIASWASLGGYFLSDFALNACNALLGRSLDYCRSCWLVTLLHLYREFGL